MASRDTNIYMYNIPIRRPHMMTDWTCAHSMLVSFPAVQTCLVLSTQLMHGALLKPGKGQYVPDQPSHPKVQDGTAACSHSLVSPSASAVVCAIANNTQSYVPDCFCTSTNLSVLVGCLVASRLAICAFVSVGAQAYKLSNTRTSGCFMLWEGAWCQLFSQSSSDPDQL